MRLSAIVMILALLTSSSDSKPRPTPQAIAACEQAIVDRCVENAKPDGSTDCMDSDLWSEFIEICAEQARARKEATSPAACAALDYRARYGCVGISIEHGGRKPRRTIGPCVTVTSRPWNTDCWMISDSAGVDMYPAQLPPSARAAAAQLLADALALPER